MTLKEYLPKGFNGDIKPVEGTGTLYEIERDRKAFGGELLLVRLLGVGYDAEELLEADIDELEARFYDDETPNQWNIRLIWAYEEENAPPSPYIRDELENDTRFAIRRCVPVGNLADFVAPLQTSRAKLENIVNHFDRSELIESIIDQNLEFLFDDSSRDEKFERLKSGATRQKQETESVSLPATSGDRINRFVDSTNLGEFRPTANLKQIDMEPFTLLYGRNGTGKTSILDGTALGLVGQIRHDENRADDYEGLNVTLQGDAEPLSTDSTAVNNRVANWFGFRPHGPANKHIEFYRVNYHETGAATRFIENDPNIDIEQTIRRLLFGEELEDARNDKEELLPRLREQIRETQDQIANLESEKLEIKETQERVSQVFSHLRIAADGLSPATKTALSTEPNMPNSNQVRSPGPDDLQQWARWEQRFADLQDGLDALQELNHDAEPSVTPGKLRHELFEAKEDIERITADIADIKELQAEHAHMTDLRDNLGQSMQGVPASVGLVALILRSHGLDTDDLAALQTGLDEALESDVAPMKAGSIDGWRDHIDNYVTQRLEALRNQKANIEKLDELDKQRRELQSQIRNKTEEYLSITDDAHYCPACYTEQDRDTILNQEKPKQLHGDPSESVPDTLLDRIAVLERAQSIINKPLWEEVDYDVSVRFDDLCGIDAFRHLWENFRDGSEDAIMVSKVTNATMNAFVTALRDIRHSSSITLSAEQVIESRIDDLEALISDLTAGVPAVAGSETDVKQLEEHYQRLSNDISASQDILEKYWQGNVRHLQLDVESDYRVLGRALDEVKQNPSTLEGPSHYDDQLSDIDAQLSKSHETVENCKDGIDRLETAFEGAGGEEKLKNLVADHMTVISTLFKVFQRPYEFEQVQYKGDRVVVKRRGEEGSTTISAMSSGQRAALALAIFVTNNIAHERAPALMMLDEPFAHLDDINTVSFFNLLIELARTGKRQILFATANADIADLLQRKVGESEDFDRVNIPVVNPTQDVR
ncbi:AAA family ATPase [Haladaptatus sp. AB618]|uniref:AAA family ATPase n=1 Tax=Haladaptatus sp. AB618 TaxID=2934173 RepID=UPI00209BF958|nr:AAA family ATPase [Haladaptatus sp. AB618]MCO8256758.1 AAA family ATPase [Haladaptatus sp. AB618]